MVFIAHCWTWTLLSALQTPLQGSFLLFIIIFNLLFLILTSVPCKASTCGGIPTSTSSFFHIQSPQMSLLSQLLSCSKPVGWEQAAGTHQCPILLQDPVAAGHSSLMGSSTARTGHLWHEDVRCSCQRLLISGGVAKKKKKWWIGQKRGKCKLVICIFTTLFLKIE